MRRLRLVIGSLVALGLVAVLAVSPAYAPPPIDPPGLDRTIAVQEYHTNSMMAVPGVVGTAVGLTADGRPAMKIFTEHPGVAGLPRSLDGVPVVVQVTGKLYALHHRPGHCDGPPDAPLPEGCEAPPPPPPPDDPATDCSPKQRCPRPVPIGVSTGHPNITAGTIGARVVDGAGYVYALSNNHVYADENNATLGDNVLQPGPSDGGVDPDDAIGMLSAFVPINFGGFNTIDAAIALSSTANLGNATPSDGYGIPKSATEVATFGLAVQKYGRTTSLTKGQVTNINAIVNVAYSSGNALFINQITVESTKPFIKGGDSGSLLVTDPGLNPVGLLFAGNQSGKFAVANRIDLVLSAFGATGTTIDGE